MATSEVDEDDQDHQLNNNEQHEEIDPIVEESRHRQHALFQRVAISNTIAITRELEHFCLTSSNAHNRSLPILENQCLHEYHDWKDMYIGSPNEMLVRYNDNNRDIPAAANTKPKRYQTIKH